MPCSCLCLLSVRLTFRKGSSSRNGCEERGASGHGTARHRLQHRVGMERGNAAGEGERGAPEQRGGQAGTARKPNDCRVGRCFSTGRVSALTRIGTRAPSLPGVARAGEPRLHPLPAGERDLGSVLLSPWVPPPPQTQVVLGHGGRAGSRGHGHLGGSAGCTAPGCAARGPCGCSATTQLPELVGNGPGHAGTTIWWCPGPRPAVLLRQQDFSGFVVFLRDFVAGWCSQPGAGSRTRAARL